VVLQHQRAVREPRETSAWVRISVHQRISHGRTDGLTDCVEPVTAKCPPTHLTRTDGRTDGLCRAGDCQVSTNASHTDGRTD
jgi:hypothetical protein